MMKQFLLFLVLLNSKLISNAPLPVYIIIHGTWAQPFTWHMPGGNFYDALAQATPPGTVTFFLWSGKNNYQARIDAAHDLVQFICYNYTDETPINLVTHSHGSNVGILASQLLAHNTNTKHRIHCFYALGTPVNIETYMPHMDSIDYFYHLFSFQDFVQPVFGLFERQYPEHERIANISVTINDKRPLHYALHHPLIAKWIPLIHERLQEQQIGNFENFGFQEPGIIHFVDNNVPCYEIDYERNKLLLRDQATIFMLNNLFRNKGKIQNHQSFAPFDKLKTKTN